MKYVFLSFFFFCTLLGAESITRQVDDIGRYQTQKKIYEAGQKKQLQRAPIYTDVQPVALQKNGGAQACMQIDTIDLENITLIEKKRLDGIVKPYVDRCDTIGDINNLVETINNIYIEKSYVTSRAYIKPQDLQRGHLVISAMEGKIETVKGKGVSTALVFLNQKEKHLNLRDLEVGIEQLNRLRSMQVTMGINPGSKEGYSDIVMSAVQVGSPFHGSLGLNNYGTAKSGKYQISGSAGWDNPFGINDLLSVNINTTNKNDNENNSIGSSISYALPIGRSYFELSYSKFKYDQTVNGQNANYSSNGETSEVKAKVEYKLFHSKDQRGVFNLSLSNKKNDNYLADVYLETSSNELTVMQLAYTHSYFATAWDGYATLTYHRGLNWFGAYSGSEAKPVFNKYTLDLNYNRQLSGEGVPARYSFSLHGQYAKEGIIGSEQIGMGGPYSVRGFKSEGQLSGNRGLYIRNELSLNQEISHGYFSPYLALDYGIVSRNEQSNGGRILGIALGTRVNYYKWALDFYRSIPILYANNLGTHHDNGFVGFSLSYSF